MADKNGRYCFLKTEEIVVPAEHNARQKFDSDLLSGLGKSMIDDSQLQPILVNFIDGKYYLIAGERRLRAAKQSGSAMIECKAFEDLDPKTVHKMALAENRERVALSTIEQARAFDRSCQLDFSIEEIAESERCSVQKVKRYLGLLSLPNDVQLMIDREKNALPIHQAEMLLKLPTESQRIQTAREIAPALGPVMGEEAARELIDSIIGKPLPFKEQQKSEAGNQTRSEAESREAKSDESDHVAQSRKKVEESEPGKEISGRKSYDPTASGQPSGELEPVDVQVGIKGKMEVDPDGDVVITKATLSFKCGDDVQIVSAKQLLLISHEFPRQGPLIEMIKNAQPKKEEKKAKKK